ncbi:hypothetical protein GCM10027443_17850 [Pontibacter brevis]
MARKHKHPKNLTLDEIEELINKYRKEAFLLNTEDVADALQEIREKGLGYSFAKKHVQGYYMWVKEKVYAQVYEQKVKAETRSRKIATLLCDE